MNTAWSEYMKWTKMATKTRVKFRSESCLLGETSELSCQLRPNY